MGLEKLFKILFLVSRRVGSFGSRKISVKVRNNGLRANLKLEP